jgi:hypothetical protein
MEEGYTDKQLETIRRMKKLPEDLIKNILSYMPKKPKPKLHSGLEKQLSKLQHSPKQSAMYLKGLDDFIIE